MPWLSHNLRFGFTNGARHYVNPYSYAEPRCSATVNTSLYASEVLSFPGRRCRDALVGPDQHILSLYTSQGR